MEKIRTIIQKSDRTIFPLYVKFFAPDIVSVTLFEKDVVIKQNFTTILFT